MAKPTAAANAIDRRALRLRSAAGALAMTLAVSVAVGLPATAPVPAPLPAPPAAAPAASVDPAVAAAIATDGVAPVIVQLAGAEHLAAAERAVVANGGVVLRSLPIVDGFSARIGAAALEQLRGLAGVLAISHDGAVVLQHDAPLGEEGGDWRYDRTVRAHRLHQQGFDGSGVGIAVIDTGVSEVADLAGRVQCGLDLSGEDNHTDTFGHGTFIAGIAAGSGIDSDGKFRGVAPGAHVVPVKIAGRSGAADISHVLAAMQYVVSFKDECDIRVLNLSLGTQSTQPNALSPLNYAVQRAWDAGIVVVVSAGNWGPEPGMMPKPADDPLVITVGALDANGKTSPNHTTVPDYSSRGPSQADGVEKPDIMAPGSHLVATRSHGSFVDENFPEAHIRDDYMRASGTSFSAAVVSGSIALLLEKHPAWTPDQVKGAIAATGAPGPVGDRNVDGHGVLDIEAAGELIDPPLANQGVVRSTGVGLMADDRGGLEVVVEKPETLLGVVVDTITKLLTGETTAQDLLEDAVEYTTTEWTSSNWYSSNWYSSNWYSSNWYSSNWYSSNWYVTDWS